MSIGYTRFRMQTKEHDRKRWEPVGTALRFRNVTATAN